MTKNIILCDLDGTLADLNHRLHYIKPTVGQKKDWDAFHKACANDTPYGDMVEIATGLPGELHILSGRNEVVREETEAWLRKHGIVYAGLHMRKAKDRRHDTVVKLEMVQQLGFTPDRVLCVFDDRQSVVDMWRENGFRCLQVQAWTE